MQLFIKRLFLKLNKNRLVEWLTSRLLKQDVWGVYILELVNFMKVAGGSFLELVLKALVFVSTIVES